MLLVVVIIMVISVVLALWSFKKQNKLEELKRAKKELLNSRVIYYKDLPSKSE